MWRNKEIWMLACLLLNISLIHGQSTTDSPYTRFGLGQMVQPGLERNRAMGGTGLAMRDNRHINYLNPASYSAIDTMSFLFDFGFSGNSSLIESSAGKDSYYSGSLDHLALAFPLTKWWAASVAVLPYSKVGYYIKEEVFDPDIGFIDFLNKGNGGINQLNLGTAFSLFEKVHIGANFKYLFGAIDLTREVDFPTEQDYGTPGIESRTVFKDFLVDLGIQYHQELGENIGLSIGFIYDHQSKIRAENQIRKQNIMPGSAQAINDSTVLNPEFTLQDTLRKGNILIPTNIGAGVTFHYKDRLKVAFDYYQQDWSGAEFFNEKEPLTNRQSFHAGIEFIPNPEALRGYYNRMSYRVGAHYENSYLQLEGEQLKDYGMSFGLGFPMRNPKSSFNIAADLGRRGTLANNLLRENYMIISFSVTLHDFWFIKRKFD